MKVSVKPPFKQARFSGEPFSQNHGWWSFFFFYGTILITQFDRDYITPIEGIATNMLLTNQYIEWNYHWWVLFAAQVDIFSANVGI